MITWAAVFRSSISRWSVPIFVLSLGVSAQATAQSNDTPPVRDAATADVDDIFQQVFGKTRPPLVEDDYVVLVEGVNVGDWRVVPPDGEHDGSIATDLIESVLLSVAAEPLSTRLAGLVGSGSRVRFEELRAAGLDIAFDKALLAVRIEIPAELRTVRTIDLRRRRGPRHGDAVEQADVSAYASVNAGLTLIEDARFARTGVSRIASDVDLVANLLGVVAQAELRFDDSRDREFSRGDVRLTYDDRNSLIRYEAGDLSVGRRPFQNAPRIAGVSAYRNFAINPYLNIRPSPQRGFELDRPARVEVALNGVAIRTFDLGSGRYNLRDFPLLPSAGNDIELRITYASGEVEIVSFPAFFDLELLAPGLIDFAANFGLPYRDDGGVRRYDDSTYNGTAYVRYGLSETLTAGINWEGDRDFDLVGAELVYASPLGTIGINASTDLRHPGVSKGQLALQYRWRDTDVERDRAIDANIILTGEDYRTLNQVFSDNLVAAQVRLRAGQKIGPDTRLQAYGGFDDFHSIRGQEYYAGMNLSRQLAFGTVSISAEYRDGRDEQGPVIRAGLSVPLGSSSFSASYTSQDNAARVQYNRLASVGVGAIGLSAGAERRDGSDRQYGRMTYTGNRFEASVQQTARNYLSRNSRDMRTDLTFGSALVMADGILAISRPVRNSFAIVRVDEAAGHYAIAVEPRRTFGSSDTSYSAFSGALGPAVLTSLTPYFNRVVEVDAPEAPAGTSLGGQVFTINPGYRSGYALSVGSAQNVSLVGNLVDAIGNPLVYAIGEAHPLGREGDVLSIQIFTNASGRFFMEGLEAGEEYRIDIAVDGNTSSATITVPDDANGTFELSTPIAFDFVGQDQKED